jgi:membrane protease YdiL (CAAX protease family)
MVAPLTPQQPPPLRATLAFAGCLYLVLLLAALAWLWQRERLAAVPASALGGHGLWVAAGSGLLAGLLGAGALALAARWSSRVRACEQRIAAVLGSLDDRLVLALSVYAAVAEEFFFRLAVQDAFGWPVAVALYVLLNTGPGFWSWAPVALGGGLVFGLMVESGLGLLSATAAHAVVNYLSLRRILP